MNGGEIVLKSCSRCGKFHPHGYVCLVGKASRATKTEESRLRNLNVWHNKSAEIRERANYLCEVCRNNSFYAYGRLEVHHIETVRDAPDKFLDDNNLICLCVSCHKQADRGEISKDYLRKLVAVRDKNI